MHGMKDLDLTNHLMILQKKTASVCNLLLIDFSTHFYLKFILKTSPDNIGQKDIEPFEPFLFEIHTAFLGLYVDGPSL